MKKNYIKTSLIMAALSLALVIPGCGKKEKPAEDSSITISRVEPTEEAATASPKPTEESAPTSTPTSTPTPTPIPVAEIDHTGHEAVIEHKGAEIHDQITSQAYIGNGLLAVCTRSDVINGEFLPDIERENNLHIIKIEDGSEIGRLYLGTGEINILGIDAAGNYIIRDATNKKVLIFSKDLKQTGSIEDIGECTYEPLSCTLYAMQNDDLCSISLDGSRKILLEDAMYTRLGNINYSDNGALLINCTDSADRMSYDYYYPESGSQKSLAVREEVGNSYLCGNTLVLEYLYTQDMFNKSVELIPLKGEGESVVKSIPCDIEFGTSALTDKFIVAVYEGIEMVHFRKNLWIVDAETGTYSETGITLLDDYSFKTCFDVKTGHYFITDNDYSNGFQNKVIEVCPECFEYEKQLAEGTLGIEEQPAEKYEAGEHLKEARERADVLEEKYGITILMGNEIKNVKSSVMYIITSCEDSGRSNEEQAENLSVVMDGIEECLGNYSKEFFDIFKDYEGNGGICMVLCEDLENPYTEFVPAGESYRGGYVNYITMDIDTFGESTVHHELWHAVEDIIVRKNNDAFPEEEWNGLNPHDFVYCNDFADYWNIDYLNYWLDIFSERENRYFARDYSMINPKEDRATLIEAFMGDTGYFDTENFDHALDYISEFPHLKAKLDFMADVCRDTLGFVYWEKS